MEEKKKNNILYIGVVIVAIIVVVILVFVLSGKESSLLPPSGNVSVIASLNGSTQAEIDEQIKKELESSRYGLNSAKVYLDPYGCAPLSALITFMSEEETDATVTIKGKHGDDLVINSEVAKFHYVPIYGLYADYNNTVEVKLGTGETQTFRIKTQNLDGMPESTVHTEGDGYYFVTSPLAMTSFVLDGHGEVRWLIDELYYHSMKQLDNGHIIIGTDDVNEQGLYTRLIEIDYLGRLYNEYNIEEGYLNEFFVKDDGNIILASKKEGRDTFSEYIIELDGETGKVVKTWDVLELLKRVDSNITSKITNDRYFYNSGIAYYPETDSLLLTYWAGEFVINLSYKDNSIKWIFSNPDNFTSKFDSLLLKGGDDFTYPKAMYSASLDGDTLRVFDNGYSTNKGDANTANLIGSYSSANTYKISGKNITLESAIDEDKKLFSYALADYKVLGANDELVMFGRELKGLDMSKGGDINNYEHLFSKIIEKKNGETVLNIDFDWGARSVDKVTFSRSEFNFDLPKTHTSLKPAKKEVISGNMLNMIGKSEETVPYEFGYSKGVIEHDILFMSSDEVKVILINDDGDGAAYTLKEANKEGLKKFATDLSSGKYYIYVLENGRMFKTDKYVELS